MKKVLLIILTIFIACGVEKKTPREPIPPSTDFVKKGWEEYKKGNFDYAYALFDTAVVLDAYNEEAYYGKGWASTQLSKIDDAISSFSFSIILYSMKGNFNRPDVPIFNEIIPESDTAHWGFVDTTGAKRRWYVKPKNINSNSPLLSYSSIKVKKGTKYVEPEYYDMDDEKIYLYDENFPNLSDTLEDTIFVNYYYLEKPQIEIPKNVLLSYSGLLASNFLKEDYLSSFVAGNVVKHLADTSLKFEYYPNTNYKKTIGLLAYSAYKKNFMGFCVKILIKLDPGWIPPPDPFDPDAKPYILEKIKEYIGG